MSWRVMVRSNHPLGLGRLERLMVYNNDMLLKFKAHGRLDVPRFIQILGNPQIEVADKIIGLDLFEYKNTSI
jgi:hypothetical protein